MTPSTAHATSENTPSREVAITRHRWASSTTFFRRGNQARLVNVSMSVTTLPMVNATW